MEAKISERDYLLARMRLNRCINRGDGIANTISVVYGFDNPSEWEIPWKEDQKTVKDWEESQNKPPSLQEVLSKIADIEDSLGKLFQKVAALKSSRATPKAVADGINLVLQGLLSQ